MPKAAGAAVRTTAAALIAALAAAATMHVVATPMLQFVLGGVTGLVTYAAALAIVTPPDARLITRAIQHLRQ
jgi:ammonia channel protein AmtB